MTPAQSGEPSVAPGTPVSIETVCRLLGAPCPEGASGVAFRGVASLEEAGPDEISFLSNPKYARHLASTAAGAVIVHTGCEKPPRVPVIRVPDPYLAFLAVLALFDTRSRAAVAEGIHPSAAVHPGAVVGKGVALGACAVIGAGVEIGDGTTVGPSTVILTGSTVGRECLLYPNVTVMDGCRIGDRVILHAGVVVGSDGFGFAPDSGGYRKIPQIGTVEIGDDVEIGANTCIDRAAFGKTVIAPGTKIDNLVQVAHNVRIGPDTVIAAQTGISGSTTVGKRVRMGGQAGLAGHIVIGDAATIGAQAGVTKDVPAGETVSGYPAKRHMEAMRLEASLRGLPDLIRKVREQEKRILELERILRERS